MRKRLISIALSLCLTAVATAATVTNVTAKQRYPWNGLVDITCSGAGIGEAAHELKFDVAAIDLDSGNTNEATHIWVVRDGTNSNDLTVSANADYHLVWNARADIGCVRRTNMVVSVTLTSIGSKRVQLWEGGPYWATTNIGAEEPWESGYYFWWGDVVGYKRENGAWVATDGSSSNFSFASDNTPTYNKSQSDLLGEGWVVSNNGTYVLAPEHDAACVHWGEGWRMPTYQELSDLNTKCDWTWTTTNGVNGYIVRGSGDYISNSIFLPCVGGGIGTSLGSVDLGYFLSSVPNLDYRDNYYLRWCYINSRGHGMGDYGRREEGVSVRPVQGFTK